MLSFKLILGVLFALLIGAVTVLAVVSYKNSQVSAQTALLMERSHRVLETTNEISALCSDVQLESNAFLVGNDSVVLHNYHVATKTVFPLITALRDLTWNNSIQKDNIDELELIIRELIAFTDSVSNGTDERPMLQLIKRIEKNNGFRNRIRGITGEIKAEEKRSSGAYEAANARSISAFNSTFIWLIACIGVLLPSTFFSIRYNFNRRIRIQAELKNANQLFTKLFYESPVGIVISRLHTGEIIDCNRVYAELVNYSKSELIGNTAVQLNILSGSLDREAIVSGARSTGTVRDIEVQLKPKDRKPIWVSVSIQSVQIRDERWLLSAILDMSVHKEAEDKMKQTLAYEIELNKLKSNFVTLASHEFRTPLTTILSSAFLLENYVAGENMEKISKHLTRIRASVNLLTSILDEFLSLTRIEEGMIQPKKELINIKTTLETLTQSFKTMARPGQRIVYTHAGDQEIYSDPLLIGNIMNNLVSNAIKYSEEGTEIAITTLVNSRINLSVKDQGIGISTEDQAHLFERFFRASNAGNIQGTGLGLHIMRHYLDMLQGSIKVVSELGKGSEFTITLDHAAPEERDQE